MLKAIKKENAFQQERKKPQEVAFSHAELIFSAYEPSAFDAFQSQKKPFQTEIACIGRSNVGKSSLINHLLRSSKLAKTSSIPGKTQSLNFYSVDDVLLFVDLPGYGYAKAPKQMQQQWSQSIDAYLTQYNSLKLILLMLDIRHLPSQEDLTFIKWAHFHQKPLLIVFSKVDKLSSQECDRQSQAILSFLKKETKNSDSFNTLFFSIKNLYYREALIKKINALIGV